MAADGYVYINFDIKENVYDAVSMIIDVYNITIDYIKKHCCGPSQKILCKCNVQPGSYKLCILSQTETDVSFACKSLLKFGIFLSLFNLKH